MSTKLDRLLVRQIARGFDESYISEGEDGESSGVRVRCSQCEALVIGGIACHESGCPNWMHECSECETLIPLRQTMCDSCANPDTFDDEEYPQDAYDDEGTEADEEYDSLD